MSGEVKADVDAAIDWLRKWPTERVHLWFKKVDPETGAEGESRGRTYARDDDGYAAMRKAIETAVGRWNIYYLVNDPRDDVTMDAVGKPTKEQMARVVALHCDIDGREGETPDEVRARIKTTADPTFEVVSGGGIQFLWLLKDPVPLNTPEAIDDIERRNLKLAEELSGDKQVRDVCRVLRLPGTINIPKEAKRKRGRAPAPAYVLRQDGRADWPLAVFPPSTSKDEAKSGKGKPPAKRNAKSTTNNDDRITPDQLAKLLTGLDAKDYGTRDTWWPIMCSAHEFTAGEGVEPFVLWSTADPKFADHGPKIRREWSGLDADKRGGITRGTLLKELHDAGRSDLVREVLPSAGWPDGTVETGGILRPVNGFANTLEAIRRLGIECKYDLFRMREYVGGHEIQKFAGAVSDDAVTMLRYLVRERCGFYPGEKVMQEAITVESRMHMYNPVIDYFDRLKWDGKPRLNTMLRDYFGAEDTLLNAAIGRKFMCAIVRRAKQPGCKWDHEPLFIGPQGARKSMGCEAFAVEPDLYTDASILTGSIKEQMEVMGGKQIIEIAEMAGFGSITRERNKALRSRKVNRARMAYDQYARDQARSDVTASTTNEDNILNDPTGERRYWPVFMTKFDPEGFAKAKDHLYAEAVALEPAENLWLDTPELEAEHAALTGQVKAPDDMVDSLADLEGEVFGDEERVSVADVRLHLGIDRTDAHKDRRLAAHINDAMRANGWKRSAVALRYTHISGLKPAKGFTRKVDAAERARRADERAALLADADEAGASGPCNRVTLV